jgi:hypothetical protein
MAAATQPLRARTVTEGAVGIAFGFLALGAVTLHAFHLDENAAFQTFVLVMVSIVVEALPFILVGAVVSAALAVFVSERAFARVARLPLAVQLPCAAVGSFAFPVCDCGTVPVARRLLARGVRPQAALAFMLAAPAVNPLVLASTFVAYGGGRRAIEIAGARSAIALAAAVAIGAIAGRGVSLRGGDSHDHHETFATHLAGDFLSMGRFIVLGAALAAFLQTVVPQSALAGVAGTPVVAELALVAIAFALSLCSQANAFVAASLGAFGLGPQLAFLVYGPLADAKLTILYSGTFRRLFALRVIAVAVPVAVAGSMLAARVIG